MDINEIVNAHKQFGTTEGDIINRIGYSQVLEFVVIAPWWSYSIFENHANKIEKVSDSVYNVYGKSFKFSFIEVKNIGAPAMLDKLLPLYLTKCKQILFIGSVGSLVEDIKIGDLVIPQCSLNGVGACRFLNNDLIDDFEQKIYPNLDFNSKIISIIEKDFSAYKVHQVTNYSVDTIFAQYTHINHFIDLGCQTIEMETSTLFRCGEIVNIPVAALLCVSDSTLKNKSLYSGRTDSDVKLKNKVRYEIIPQIIIKICKDF